MDGIIGTSLKHISKLERKLERKRTLKKPTR